MAVGKALSGGLPLRWSRSERILWFRFGLLSLLILLFSLVAAFSVLRFALLVLEEQYCYPLV